VLTLPVAAAEPIAIVGRRLMT